jgi:hypothetical protein
VILNFTDKKNFAICRQLSKLFSARRKKNPIIIFSFSCQSPCQRATVANHAWKALYTSVLSTAGTNSLYAKARIHCGKVSALSGTGRLSRKILCIVEKPERDLLLKRCRA